MTEAPTSQHKGFTARPRRPEHWRHLARAGSKETRWFYELAHRNLWWRRWMVDVPASESVFQGDRRRVHLWRWGSVDNDKQMNSPICWTRELINIKHQSLAWLLYYLQDTPVESPDSLIGRLCSGTATLSIEAHESIHLKNGVCYFRAGLSEFPNTFFPFFSLSKNRQHAILLVQPAVSNEVYPDSLNRGDCTNIHSSVIVLTGRRFPNLCTFNDWLFIRNFPWTASQFRGTTLLSRGWTCLHRPFQWQRRY